mmetsp:Transcript_43059/g.111644  ORF Transcript_43059/g.111644 Transcript_43059/m.111644 type:complete len:366 (-) Transcript_43059:307-1404(-)
MPQHHREPPARAGAPRARPSRVPQVLLNPALQVGQRRSALLQRVAGRGGLHRDAVVPRHLRLAPQQVSLHLRQRRSLAPQRRMLALFEVAAGVKLLPVLPDLPLVLLLLLQQQRRARFHRCAALRVLLLGVLRPGEHALEVAQPLRGGGVEHLDVAPPLSSTGLRRLAGLLLKCELADSQCKAGGARVPQGQLRGRRRDAAKAEPSGLRQAVQAELHSSQPFLQARDLLLVHLAAAQLFLLHQLRLRRTRLRRPQHRQQRGQRALVAGEGGHLATAHKLHQQRVRLCPLVRGCWRGRARHCRCLTIRTAAQRGSRVHRRHRSLQPLTWCDEDCRPSVLELLTEVICGPDCWSLVVFTFWLQGERF